MAWERELWTFIWVLAVVRDRAPSFRHCIICYRAKGQQCECLHTLRKDWNHAGKTRRVSLVYKDIKKIHKT